MHSNKQRYFITHFYVSMYHFICHSVKMTKHGFPQRVNFSSRGVYATTRQKLYLNCFSFLRNCPSCGLRPTYTQSLVFCLAKGCEKKTPLMSQYISQLVMLFSLSKKRKKERKDQIHSLRKEEYTVLFVEWPTTQLPLYKTGFEKLQQINSSPKI